ncbi:MAG: tyrosine-type recombinase/integrase [Actinobacteria bacterium]|nr:tyrosine-type recombinase/integrase [Actinomycetota bacterium]
MTETWADLIHAWASAQRAAGRSTQTIGLRTYHVRRLHEAVGDVDPWSVTLDDVLAWTGGQDRWSWATRRSVRSSLRGWWRWAVATGRTTVDVGARLPVVPVAQPMPRLADPAGVVVAMHEADERVLLMLRLAHGLGMRRGEVAQVHTDDLTRDLIGWSLHVHGKGSRDRVLPLDDSLARAIRREAGTGGGYAFPGAIDGHLSARWVGRLVARMLPGTDTMHSLRHLAATEVHDATHDLPLVRRMLGHASLATTQAYVHVRDDALRTALVGRSQRAG